nr:hypothetical protein [Pseudonocardia sp. AL041005-10]
MLVTTGVADPLVPQRLSSPQLSVLAPPPTPGTAWTRSGTAPARSG